MGSNRAGRWASRLGNGMLLATCCAHSPAYAQGESPIPFEAAAPAAFELSFANPGARSLGFGGAFVALADDATAAFANPAGLVQLVRSEVSIEGRYTEFTTSFTSGGRLSGGPTGIGIDSDSGPTRSVSSSDVESVSFASVVYPRGRFSLALYYHRFLDFESSLATSGLFDDQADPPFAPRQPDLRASTSAEASSHGFSAGLRLTEEWSVGAGIVYHEISIATRSQFFLPPPNALGIFGAPTFGPETLAGTSTAGGVDSDWTFNAGLLWQPGKRWSFGGVYRQGPELGFEVDVESGPAIPFLPPGTTLFLDRVDPMTLPDVYGLGTAFRALDDRITVSFEWDRVEYSDIIESFNRDLGDSGGALDDGDEFHLGAEYAFLGRSPVIAIRGGVWLDPDHKVRAEGARGDRFLGALFEAGNDEWHAALGLGVAFSDLQIDLAGDFSDRVDTVAVSAIYTF